MPPVSPFPHITTARSESFDLPDGWFTGLDISS
jgi:hypothetical protein